MIRILKILLLCSVGAGFSASAETVRLTAPEGVFETGDQFTISVLLENILDGDIAAGIEAMELAINYSDSLLLVSAANGSALATATAPVVNDYVLDENNRRTQVVGISSLFPIATIEGGELLELIFEVQPIAGFTVADINLTDLAINEEEFVIYNPNYDAAVDVMVSTVPIPAAVWLFGSALGLAGLASRRK